MYVDFDLLNNKLPLDVKEITFPDSQPHFEGNFYFPPNKVIIASRLSNGADLLRIMVLLDYLNRKEVREVRLKLSYVLGARMDRVINGGALTPSVIGSILRSSPVKIVSTTILDPHSDVITSHLPNGTSLTPLGLVSKAVGNMKTLLLSPDLGAAKKVEAIANDLNVDFTSALKHRDPFTGNLSGFQLVDPAKIQKARRILIVDDICDGGGTFAGVAAKIHEWTDAPVDLFVTHGIFSGPKKHKIDGINWVYTTDSFRAYDDVEYGLSQRLTVFNLIEENAL